MHHKKLVLGFMLLLLLLLTTLVVDLQVMAEQLARWARPVLNEYFWLVFVLFVAAYGAIVGFSMPLASAASLLAGLLFGFWLGFLAIMLSVAFGMPVNMWLAERLVGAAQKESIGTRFGWILQELEQAPARTTLMLRLLPIFPFVLVNLLPSLLPIHRGVFYVVSLLGVMPGAMAVLAVAEGAGGLADGFDPFLLVWVGAGLAVLMLLQMLAKAWAKSKNRGQNP